VDETGKAASGGLLLIQQYEKKAADWLPCERERRPDFSAD